MIMQQQKVWLSQKKKKTQTNVWHAPPEVLQLHIR